VTIFDYIVLFILISSILISMIRGLVKEILSLLSWVIAFVLANAFGESLAKMLPAALPGHGVRMIVAFIALFIGVRILMGLLTMVIEAIVKASGLSIVDRGLGGLFGLARGMLMVMVAVLLCGMTSIPRQDFWTNALLSPFVVTGARTAMTFLPADIVQHVHF